MKALEEHVLFEPSEGLVDSPFLMPRPYSNSRVDKAGEFITMRVPWPDNQDEWGPLIDDAFDVVWAWRDLHAYPLDQVSRTLERRTLSVDQSAIFAQRLKRLRSIDLKLRNEPAMHLTTMQDMAGCRAVVDTIQQAYAIKEKYESYSDRYPEKGPELIGKWTKDYISTPKMDGYRSIHLVLRYRTKKPSISHYNGLRVEVQIRSRLQHAWAMAVETASSVTNQALKSGRGEDRWKRFFKLMGCVIAMREECPLVPDVVEDPSVLRAEAAKLAAELKVIPLLEGMSHVLVNFSSSGADELYLMTLDSQERKVHYKGYKQEDFNTARKDYAQEELSHRRNDDVHVVLVAVKSINELREAYPSYFLDSTKFITLVREIFQ
ncbi:MAG: RelA/SpoT domain-containing protein [Bryobacteraceae bacterium]